jgi:hypothetical protein
MLRRRAARTGSRQGEAMEKCPSSESVSRWPLRPRLLPSESPPRAADVSFGPQSRHGKLPEFAIPISEPACAYVYVFQNECLYCMYVGVLYIHIQKVHMCVYFYPHVHMSVCVCIVCMCMYLKNLFLQIHTDIYRYIQYIQYMHIHAK